MTYQKFISQSEFLALLESSFSTERIFVRIYVVRQNYTTLTKESLSAHILSGFFTASDDIGCILPYNNTHGGMVDITHCLFGFSHNAVFFGCMTMCYTLFNSRLICCTHYYPIIKELMCVDNVIFFFLKQLFEKK